jgi:hypothetical protein
VSNLALQDLEQKLLAHPQVECPVTHHFGGGIYLREMFAPAGTLVLGHEHVGDHMCILLKGKMRILTPDGDAVKEIAAPLIFTASAGRKLAIALEDTVFINVFPTEETDPEKCEAIFVKKSEVWTEHQLKAASAKLIKGEET